MNKRVIPAGLLAALLALSTGDAVGQMTHDILVSADWLTGHLADAHVAVLHADMRKERYDSGHIPGARFLDMSRLVWDGDPAWGTEMRDAAEIAEALEAAGVGDDLHHIVIYADNPLFASRAFMTLEVMGLRGRVQMLDGGYGGWIEDGRETSTEEPEFARGDIQLEPRSDILVSADWILERLDDDGVALVDARPDDEYTGDDGGMGGDVHAGHIPGAVQMYWEELVESRPVPRVHPSDELAEMFTAAGADQGDTVVAYCMVGWRASFTYFAARMLGYETKFYDGSWHEWGSRDELPYVSGRTPR